MIKHHPKFELLQSFVNGDLPASLSVGINLHAEMCPICQGTIAQLTEQVAEVSFEKEESVNHLMNADTVQSNEVTEVPVFDFDSMIQKITDSEAILEIVELPKQAILFKEQEYVLPNALSRITLGKVSNIGKLSRTRLQLNEEEIHSNILHIGAGGSVPEHEHKGFELTVLLDGEFRDENGTYEKGDFIMLDSNHKHNPISDLGCLCYTVANAPLHFTQGINKLLNPIGNFIY